MYYNSISLKKKQPKFNVPDMIDTSMWGSSIYDIALKGGSKHLQNQNSNQTLDDVYVTGLKNGLTYEPMLLFDRDNPRPIEKSDEIAKIMNHDKVKNYLNTNFPGGTLQTKWGKFKGKIGESPIVITDSQ